MILTGRTTDGEEVEITTVDDRSLSGGVQILIPPGNLVEIDLSPLSSLDRMWKLTLAHNQLQEIDLTPLSENNDLEILDLEGNQLPTIDLTPLHSCGRLKELRFSDNQLQSVDLSPLSQCTHVYLGANQLQSITFAPSGRVRELHLDRNQIQEIDLSSLSDVRILQLSRNQIQEIVLPPFTRIAMLVLSDNQIREIDLSPLGVASLKGLYLDGNQIQQIDLSPLSECHSLNSLDISNNQLEQIDLSPLLSCRLLLQVNIDGNKLEAVDVSPVLHPEKLFLKNQENLVEIRLISFLGVVLPSSDLQYLPREVFVLTPPAEYPWSYAKSVLELWIEREEANILNGFLSSLGLGLFNALDEEEEDALRYPDNWVTELLKILDSLGPDLSWDQVRSEIVKGLLPLLCKQIDDCGPVIFLTLDRISEFAEIALRLERISELKRQEMERVVLLVGEEYVDLKPLWLTAHGFEVLSSLDVGLRVRVERLKMIEESLERIGFKDTVKQVSSSAGDVRYSFKPLLFMPSPEEEVEFPVKMSHWMRSYIWTIATYSAEGWPLP